MHAELDDIVAEPLSPETEPCVKDLIKRNLQDFEEAGTVLAATFRRLNDLLRVYRVEGARFFVLKDAKTGQCVGGAGLGSLHSLPVSEGMGEIRDLVLDEAYRGRGHGSRLLKRCVEEARKLGYKRLYLETTPQMDKAQKLFLRFGFRPVTQAQPVDARASGKTSDVPCYFILDDLNA